MGGFFGTGRQVADQSSNRLMVFKKTGKGNNRRVIRVNKEYYNLLINTFVLL